MSDYVKMSQLVGDIFTVTKVWGYNFKKYEDGKMLISDRYQPGYRKVYQIDTDKGKLDVGEGQMGTLLEKASKNGASDINNKTFEVSSNGKTGMEIRYYFNVIDAKPLPDKELNGEIDIEDIPF